MNIVHNILIILYTAFGGVSFTGGLLVMILRRTGWLFQGYLWSMMVMIATLVTVVIWDWPLLLLPTQILYVALALLAVYSIYRGFSALQKQAHRYTGWRLEFMDDVGFTLIYLFDALVIVGAIDLEMPAWAIISLGVVGIIVGWKWVQYEKQRYVADRKKRNERNLRKL